MKAERVSKLTFASGAALAMAAGASGVQAQGVEGAYVGISAGAPKGDNFLGYAAGNYSFTGASVGVFAGYNAVQNGMVYGFEFDYANKADVGNNGSSYYDGMGLNDIIDIRGRLGTTFGKAFVYGAAGFSTASVQGPFNSNIAANQNYTTSARGFNIGVGVEMSVGQNGFIGADITHRRLKVKPIVTYGSYDPSDINMNTISVRAGLRF